MIDDKIVMAIVGIIGGLITFLQKVLWTQGKNNYEITVKLIERFNRSAADIARRIEAGSDASSRRHEKILEEMNSVTDDLSYVKGRLNSKAD